MIFGLSGQCSSTIAYLNVKVSHHFSKKEYSYGKTSLIRMSGEKSSGGIVKILSCIFKQKWVEVTFRYLKLVGNRNFKFKFWSELLVLVS